MESFWKNKKIAVYIALKHHTRLIVPITEQIARQGGDIIYLVGQAERSQEITAMELGLNYYHIFEFITAKDTDQIHKTYQYLKNGFAKALLKDTVFSLQVPTVLDKTLYANAQEYTGFKNFMNRFAPDLCIALHEVNRWGKVFAFHAKKRNIPCVTLQEGQFTNRSEENKYKMTGHVQYSTLDLVWGEGTKQLLSTYEAPEERIVATGNTHINAEINRLRKEKIRSKKRKKYQCGQSFVTCLFFSQTLPEVSEIYSLINYFNQTNKKKLFIKFHPSAPRSKISNYLSMFDKKTKKSIHFFHDEESAYNMIEMADVVVVAEATNISLETLALGKPLVILKLKAESGVRSFLPEKKAALAYTPEELTEAIKNNTDFTALMDPQGVSSYIKEELHDPENSIENTLNVLQSCISANSAPDPAPLSPEAKTDKQWTIILPVVDRPEIFLSILESVSINSKDHNFEVILIKPRFLSQETAYILDSLEGDVSILESFEDETLPAALNRAAVKGKGCFLAIPGPFLYPSENWLDFLETGFGEHGTQKIFGARVINQYGNIVHAGMVLDANNSAVSAYALLDANFPPANKTRSFHMVDRFIGVEKEFFLSLGGFHEKAGDYCFMDLSLRAREKSGEPDSVVYLPKVLMNQFDTGKKDTDTDASIFFHSRWHGTLLENEDDLYKQDGVSQLQLDAARMTRAMEATSFK